MEGIQGLCLHPSLYTAKHATTLFRAGNKQVMSRRQGGASSTSATTLLTENKHMYFRRFQGFDLEVEFRA